MAQGKIAFNTLQVRLLFLNPEFLIYIYIFFFKRRWAGIELDRPYQIRPYKFNKNVQSITTLVLDVDFLNKKRYDLINNLFLYYFYY